MQGCQVAVGLEIDVCPAGVAQAGVALSLLEFSSLGEHDKGDGEHGICCSSRLPETAQQGRECRAGWREAPLGASACGFPLGISAGCSSRSPACFPELKLGSRTPPSTLRRSLGQERACPVSSTQRGCRAPPLPENGPPVNSKSLPLSGKFKPVKTCSGTIANKYDLSHWEPQARCEQFQTPT